MPLPKIDFNINDGGLGRRLPGEDHVSGLLFYGTKPVEFGTDTVKKVRSLKQAETFGLVGASYAVENYHIKEFFRINPGADLYVGYYAVPGEYTFAEITTMQNATNGKMRQLGVFVTIDFAIGQIALLQTQADALRALKKTLHIIYAPDITSITDLGDLPDLRAEEARSVSVVISEDGGGAGRALANSKAYSISTLGATLGTVSKAAVHENIGWVQEFQMDDITYGELDVLAISNGTLQSTLTDAELDDIHDLGYIFMRKIANLDGSYHTDAPTCIAVDSDYAYIENSRTVDKAIREVYKAVVPRLNSPLYTNPTTGKMTYDTVSSLEELAKTPLATMVADGNLSGATAIVDPDQDVLSTSQVEFNLKLVPVGVMRKGVINIGFAIQI